MKFLEALRASKIVGIVRGIEPDELGTLADGCKNAGLGFIEITMNTPDAAHKIRALTRMAEGAFRVGAGTVLTVSEFRQAVDAGAYFIVSPVLVREVAAVAASVDIPFLPGALTPQEVYEAHAAGATLVKVFPVQFFGPAYIRELRAPFHEIPLLACGGIRPTNVGEYLQSGADAVAIGGGTLKREWLADHNVAALSAALRELIAYPLARPHLELTANFWQAARQVFTRATRAQPSNRDHARLREPGRVPRRDYDRARSQFAGSNPSSCERMTPSRLPSWQDVGETRPRIDA